MAEAINRHLTLLQRCKIETYLSSGQSQRAIAQRFGVSPAAVSRENRRNRIAGVGYETSLTQLVAVKRRRDASAHSYTAASPFHLRLPPGRPKSRRHHPSHHDSGGDLSTPWI